MEDYPLETMARKRDQAYELAGCARKDRDRADEIRWLGEAKYWEARIAGLVGPVADQRRDLER